MDSAALEYYFDRMVGILQPLPLIPPHLYPPLPHHTLLQVFETSHKYLSLKQTKFALEFNIYFLSILC